MICSINQKNVPQPSQRPIQPFINDRQSIHTLFHALHTPLEVQLHSKFPIGDSVIFICAEVAVQRGTMHFFLARFAPK